MPKPRSEDSILLTFSETAETLRVDRSTVYRLVADRPDFPKPIRVGHAPRFLRSAIEKYVAEQAERAS